MPMALTTLAISRYSSLLMIDLKSCFGEGQSKLHEDEAVAAALLDSNTAVSVLLNSPKSRDATFEETCLLPLEEFADLAQPLQNLQIKRPYSQDV